MQSNCVILTTNFNGIAPDQSIVFFLFCFCFFFFFVIYYNSQQHMFRRMPNANRHSILSCCRQFNCLLFIFRPDSSRPVKRRLLLVGFCFFHSENCYVIRSLLTFLCLLAHSFMLLTHSVSHLFLIFFVLFFFCFSNNCYRYFQFIGIIFCFSTV